jgi:hypothetical protein
MKSLRTKQTSISPEVKKKVHERDLGCCVVCGMPLPVGCSSAHIIPRSRGGLGIEQNIITLCQEHHYNYDFSVDRLMLYDYFVEYLKKFYADWDRDKMIFKKGQNEGRN